MPYERGQEGEPCSKKVINIMNHNLELGEKVYEHKVGKKVTYMIPMMKKMLMLRSMKMCLRLGFHCEHHLDGLDVLSKREPAKPNRVRG